MRAKSFSKVVLPRDRVAEALLRIGSASDSVESVPIDTLI